MVGNSKHKHFTERDQRLYSTPLPLGLFQLLTVRKLNSGGNSKITRKGINHK